MDTIILQKTYHLYQWLDKIIDSFLKRERYSLGVKLENHCLSLLEEIVTIEQVPPVLKDQSLIRASVKLQVLKLLVRLTMEKKLIKPTVYFSLSSLMIEIGKMIGGWRKSLRK